MNTRITQIRKHENMNQDEFANALGLTKNFISLVETGKREPSERTIRDICREFNVNEDWLRTGEGEMFMPRSKEHDIAKLTVDILEGEEDSFKSRLISMLARLGDDEWEMLEAMVDKLSKKE